LTASRSAGNDRWSGFFVGRELSIVPGIRCWNSLTGIAQHHISEMENGKRPIGKETAKKLAAVLNGDYRIFL